MNENFNTLNDHRAREVRNLLGRAFVAGLDHNLDLAPVLHLAKELATTYPESNCTAYIDDRLDLYKSAKARIMNDRIDESKGCLHWSRRSMSSARSGSTTRGRQVTVSPLT